MSGSTSLKRQTRREPMYIYLILLASFILTGLVFTALYLFLYPYLAIRPPGGNGGGAPSGPAGPPPSLPNQFVSIVAYYLTVAFTSQPALALFYTILLASTFLNEFSYIPLAFYHSRIEEQRSAVELTRYPSICVIVPAHNEEKTIETTITTLLDQNYPNKEIMIVNDGSKDGTAPVVAPYATSGKVTLLNRPVSGGKAVAVNTGIAATRAEIIVVVDADSALQRDALMRIAGHLG